MAKYDNPAGRLYDLLLRFTEKSGETIFSAWTYALACPPEELARQLSWVAEQIDEVMRAIDESGQDLFSELPHQVESLKRTVFPFDHAIGNAAASNVVPDPLVMQGLDMLAKYLSQHAPEATVPNGEEVGQLAEEVKRLMGAVLDAEDLPPEIQRLLLQQLAQILQALHSLRVRGPLAVRLATLALLGSTATVDYVQPDRHRRLLESMRDFVTKSLVAFAFVAPLGADALGYQQLIQQQLGVTTPQVQLHVVEDITVIEDPPAAS